MKKLTILVCVLAMLLALTGVASASKPEPATFSITGYTTFYEWETLPNGRTKFHLTALGAVSGYFTGTFTFEEWGEVDLDPSTGEGSGKGKNHGIMTITTAEGEAIIRFNGKADSETVWGEFKVLHKEGTGAYQDLQGKGKYTGNAGLVFTVDFTGQFHTHP
ncbi:MAG: hypothetical protein WBW48_15130 [Anaerolineae bacterium]